MSSLFADEREEGTVLASSSLSERYSQVRGQTTALAAPLSAEDQMLQAMADASPTKWHLAHTSWFFETFILSPHAPGYCPPSPHYRNLFNSYYNTVGDRPARDRRGIFSRPSLAEVMLYRAHVDKQMLALLEGNLSGEVAAIVELGLQHEQQHQELIVTDIKYAFWCNGLHPTYQHASEAPALQQTPDLQWISYERGVYFIGHAHDSFAFDNELPRHEVLLHPYRIASRLITNGEYIEFVRDGGYRRPELWFSDGWEAVRTNGWQSPLYWERDAEGRWRIFTCTGMRNLEESEPVCHVSYYEASAFACWAGARLATEEEWEWAAAGSERRGNFLEQGRYHPTSLPLAASERPKQLFGDVWEWTASPYVAYPGYKPASGALGEYNGKFMCNQMVLRGGSCATPESHIRHTYRNFFPPHARWQFSGIRLANENA